MSNKKLDTTFKINSKYIQYTHTELSPAFAKALQQRKSCLSTFIFIIFIPQKAVFLEILFLLC